MGIDKDNQARQPTRQPAGEAGEPHLFSEARDIESQNPTAQQPLDASMQAWVFFWGTCVRR
jgi:hypothetical protein